MKNIKKIIIIIFYVVLTSCGDRNINDEEDLIKCKSEVINSGDLTSYFKLLNHYDKDTNYYEILPYSLKMLEHDQIAYGDFFTTYLRIKFKNEFDRNNISQLNKSEADFLLYILNKGALSDDTTCKEILAYYYKNGIGVDKNIQKSDSIIISSGYSYHHAKTLLSQKIDSLTYEQKKSKK